MPTGYTAALYEGEQSFEDFVLGCARAFGATILMRDSDSDSPITIEAITDDSDYHERALASARSALHELEFMSVEQAAARAKEEHEEIVASWQRRRADSAAKRERYEGMLAQVREWQPPSDDHIEFKQFMIEQLTGSIDFDTNTKYDGEPESPETGEAWLARKIERARRDITYHQEKRDEQNERNESRIRWVSQLFETLNLEVPAA